MSIRSIIKEIVISELTKDEVKSQVDIIYKDPSIIAMVPKSQMASAIYGGKTKWCQVDKAGFDAWSKQGLLIRFLFKNGRKIRFTYFFPQYTERYFGDYYWANEKGYHVLTNSGNPFEAKSNKGKREKDIEKDILNLIKQIPEECKEKVLKFIELNKKAYDYCYSDKQYVSSSLENIQDEFTRVNQAFRPIAKELYHLGEKLFINIKLEKESREFVINYSDSFGVNNNYITKEEKFKKVEDFENRLNQITKEYLTIGKQELKQAAE